MRGASAESLARLTELLSSALDGDTDALHEPAQSTAGRLLEKVASAVTPRSAPDAMRVADDLMGVAGILRREPSLRRTVTDATLQADAKAQLVRGVFGGQLDATSTDLVAAAVRRRWAAPRDLADSLEQLGVIAVVRGADRAGEADRLEDDLFAFGRLAEDNPELRDALSDPARSDEDKRALLDRLLDGKVSPGALRLAQQAVVGSHRTVALAVQEYQRVAAAHRQRLVAVARVARNLEGEDFERLERVLAEQYGRPVHLNVLVDPAVIGGVRVEIGEDVIDGTVATRLDEARRRMVG
jgi:F-type H+-transporting ATPase subunit delta